MGYVLVINFTLWLLLQFLIACSISFLPNHLFNPYSGLYRSRKWEQEGEIYNRIFRVKKWKNQLPVGRSFIVDDINLREFKKRNSVYGTKYLQKSCKAETIHIISVVSMILFLIKYNIFVTGVVIFLTLLINLPFLIILRYNRPRIIRIMKKSK